MIAILTVLLYAAGLGLALGLTMFIIAVRREVRRQRERAQFGFPRQPWWC